MKFNFDKIFNKIKKRKKIIIIVVVLLLVDIFMGIIGRFLIDSLPEQNAAHRWSDEKRMGQVSLFFTEDQKIATEDIKRLEYVMEGNMRDAGIVSDDDESKSQAIVDTQSLDETYVSEEAIVDDSRLYASSYCAQGILDVTFENKTAENVSAIGVAGDFFLFHPLELVSGVYFSDDNVMKDQIVIDEDLAWQLFGSNDVAGQMVTIGGVPHYVSGVVKREEGRIREASGLSNTIIYLSYDSLCKYGTILSGKTESVDISEDGISALSGGINCYEVVMPNPVDGIVATIVQKSTNLDDKYVSIIDNTDRFNFISLFKVISAFGTRSMWTKAIYYPYWENTARGYEDILALMFMIQIICRTVLVVIAVITIVQAYRNKSWTVREIVQYLADKKYDLDVRRNQKRGEKL